MDANFTLKFYSVFGLRFSLSFGSVFFLFASQAKRKKMNGTRYDRKPKKNHANPHPAPPRAGEGVCTIVGVCAKIIL